MADYQNYQTEVDQYLTILGTYETLTDVDQAVAFDLMQRSLALAERFSEIHFEVRKDKALSKSDAAALKDRMWAIYRILREVHVGCRQIANRGKEG
ncbi:MAG: hypothetical protein M0021_09935 [Clostridia bacterium]|nr:hypothetical protein [Clostridia bacterium]